MVDVKNAGAAFGCSSVSLPSDRLGRYLHLVLFENSQDLFGPNFPELADLDDACLALFRDTLGGCRELDDEHFQAIEDLPRIDRKSVVKGERWSVRVDLGGRRITKKQKPTIKTT